jgi:hypothetical protein
MTDEQYDGIIRALNDLNETLMQGMPYGEYQLCPKCRGQKHLHTPPWVAGDQYWLLSGGNTAPELYTCPVCEGAGVIERPRAKE